jgi:hypothetical protein
MTRNGEPDYLVITKCGNKDVTTYVHWLYTGKIPTSACDQERGTITDPIWIDLSNAYVFGEEINDRRYQQAVIENMAQLQNDSLLYPPAKVFSIIYYGTPEDSTPIRMLLSDMWIWGVRANIYTEDKLEAWMDELVNDIPGEAGNDLIEAMNRLHQRLQKDSNCEPSWAEYTEGYLRYAEDYY